MVCDDEDAVKTVRGWEFDNEVHGDGFKREGGMISGDRVVRYMGVSCEGLGGLAGGTALDKGGDEVLHVGPPVVFGEEKTSFQDARVTCCGRVMIQ